MTAADINPHAVDWSRTGWRYRAIEATHGPRTEPGLVVLAVLDKAWRYRNGYTGPCEITADGIVRAPCRVDMIPRGMRKLCPARQFSDMCKRIAEIAKMDDAEAQEWMGEVRKWIAVDHRLPGEHGRPLLLH